MTYNKSVYMGKKNNVQSANIRECEYEATAKGNLNKHQKSVHMAKNSNVKSVNTRQGRKVFLLPIINLCI